MVGVAVLTSCSAGAGVAPAVAELGGEVTGADPSGGVPKPAAVLEIPPASTSAWVATYVPVQVIEAPGARRTGEPGQVASGALPVPLNDSSCTPMRLRVTLPVFVIAKE